jgi:hypothetical protein
MKTEPLPGGDSVPGHDIAARKRQVRPEIDEGDREGGGEEKEPNAQEVEEDVGVSQRPHPEPLDQPTGGPGEDEEGQECRDDDRPEEPPSGRETPDLPSRGIPRWLAI